jgi:hypothetical protein
VAFGRLLIGVAHAEDIQSMSETDLNPVPDAAPPVEKWQSFRARGWRAELPYIVMLVAAFVGTATSKKRHNALKPAVIVHPKLAPRQFRNANAELTDRAPAVWRALVDLERCVPDQLGR